MTTLAAELSSGKPYFFPLQSALVYRITDRDASRYLNARFSNNIKDLAINTGCAAAALSPQGRTELFGSILKINQEEFLFITDGGEEAQVKATLARFKVADRVDFTYLTELALIHIINLETVPLEEAHYTLAKTNREYSPFHNQAITLYPIKRSTEMGYDIVLPKSRATDLVKLLSAAGINNISSTDQKISKIMAKRPSYPDELNDDGIFLEAGLSHAVSFTKGCYVGQEVLEKVDSHGRLPYSIVSLKSLGKPPLSASSGSPLFLKQDSQQKVGESIGGAIDEHTGEDFLFARLKSAHISHGAIFTIQGQEYQLI
jgi:folate-binding protein YgfZ